MSGDDLQEQLLQALVDGKFPEFRELLGHPAVNPGHKYGKPHFSTCLEIACRHRGREEFVKALLTKVKPNINQIVPEPIHYAAGKGNPEALDVLLKDKRIKVNAEDSWGRTALHHVAKNFCDGEDSERYEQCVALLLARSDLDINRANKKGFTAIHEAAAYANKKAVEAFLKCGRSDLDLDSSLGRGRAARQLILQKYPELKGDLPIPKSESISLVDPHIQLLNALRNDYFDIFRALLMQADSNGDPVMDPNHWYDIPYQTTCLETACSEIGRERFIMAALQAGADPNMVNVITEWSPIHVAVAAGNHEALKILLFNEHTKVNVNVVDKTGKTALHYAVDLKESEEEKSNRKLECLKLLLERIDLNINIQDTTKQPAIMVAVFCGNKEAIEIMLQQEVHKLDLDNFRGFENNTIRDSIINTFPDLDKYLPPPQVVEDRSPNVMALLFQHLYKKQEEEFALLLETFTGNDIVLLNSDDGNNSLLQYASRYGLNIAICTLLSRGADPNAICPENKCPSVVLACLYKHYDALKYFIHIPKFNINATDMKGNSALHYAVRDIHLETVIFLLNHGADMGLKNVLGKRPFGGRELESLLDKCIKTNNKFLTEENYEVIFDYRLLTSLTSSNDDTVSKTHKIQQMNDCTISVQHKDYNNIPSCVQTYSKSHEDLQAEMKFLSFVSQSKENMELLKHPVVVSFLELKWRRVRYISYINLAMYIMFLVLLTMYITPSAGKSYYLQNIIPNDCFTECMAIRYCLSGFVVLLLVRELFQLTMSFKKYFKNLENMLDVSLICLTGYITMFEAPRHNESRQGITIGAILLSWLEMLLLTGRLPIFSKNIEMLKVVLRNYFSICTSYFILIIAFTLSFHTLYQDRCDYATNGTIILKDICIDTNVTDTSKIFTSIPMSFLKIITMMTGEYDSTNLMMNTMPFICSVLFVMFVFLVAIVLLNLLIGLAVNDTQNIQQNAELLCLQTRVKVTVEIESILTHFHGLLVWARIPCICLHRIILFSSRVEKKLGVMRPNVGADIKLSSHSRSYKLKRKVLDTAVRIISSKNNMHQSEGQDNKRLQRMEKSMQKILEAVETIKQQLSEEACDGRSRLSS